MSEQTIRVLYGEAVYGREEADAVARVIADQPHQLMVGPQVAAFEDAVATLFGKAHGVMTNSGSSANLIAVAVAGLPRGSQVVTPALTFSTTVAPLVQHGLVPAFVDVEPDTFNIDVDQIESIIGPKTRAIMVPNLIGNLSDWARIADIATRHDLRTIEDSCDTIGATLRGGPTGAHSHVTTTSFYGSHVITAGGFGGMLMTSVPAIADRARLLRGWGRSSSLLGEVEDCNVRFESVVDGVDYDAKYEFSGIGYNFLPSEIGAAFGLQQLHRLAEFKRRRIANHARLTAFLGRWEQWFTLPRQLDEVSTPWLAFPFIVRDDAPFTRRDLQRYLEGEGIQTRVIFSGNILRQPGFRGIERVEHPGGFPNADRVMRGGILIGCHQGLQDFHLDYVEDAFTRFARTFE
ncbi:MAG: aminotransferase class I/II-fold pyridoxal phosphate-dependent enzyme [Nannocystaceae bacterium]